MIEVGGLGLFGAQGAYGRPGPFFEVASITKSLAVEGGSS